MSGYRSPFQYSPDYIRSIDAWLRDDTPDHVRDALKQIERLHYAVMRVAVHTRDPLEELRYEYEKMKESDGEANASRVNSYQWLDDFCESTGTIPPLDNIIEMGKDWAKGEESEYFTNDGENIWCGDAPVDCKIPPEFWTHLENVVAAPIPARFKAKRFAQGG